MDKLHSQSVDSNTVPLDSNDLQGVAVSKVLITTISLALITGLALELVSRTFKLEKDFSQILIFPLILLAFVYLFRSQLPQMVKFVLLSTPILSIFCYFLSQGQFGSRGSSYISKLVVGPANPGLEKLRVDFNWESERLNFSNLKTIYRNFTEKSAEEWGKGSNRLLIYSDPRNPRLKLFLDELSQPQPVKLNNFTLDVHLFPEWIPVDPKGFSVEYLTMLAKVLPSLDSQKEKLQKLEDIGFAGYGAGATQGLWNSPVPRAAALFLGASANLAKDNVLNMTDIICIRKELSSALRKVRKSNSPELTSLILNNLAVANLLLDYRRGVFSAAKIVSSRIMFAEASSMRNELGEVVLGAKLATKNLFALNAAGLVSGDNPKRLKGGSQRSKKLGKKISRKRISNLPRPVHGRSHLPDSKPSN
jgi:hypothetical protein